MLLGKEITLTILNTCIWQVMLVNTQASTLEMKPQTQYNLNFVLKVGITMHITGNHVNVNVNVYLIDLCLLGSFGANEKNC